MGDIWWDIFCPNDKCKGHVHGDTCNTEDEFKKQTDEFENKIIPCEDCGTKFNASTLEVVE